MSTTPTKYFAISEGQITEIGTYLLGRPYREVEGFINIFRSLPTVVQEQPKAEVPVVDPAQLEIPFPAAGEDIIISK